MSWAMAGYKWCVNIAENSWVVERFLPAIQDYFNTLEFSSLAREFLYTVDKFL